MTTRAGTGLLATRDYFDNLRQYKNIAEMECEFFKLLLEKKSELTGLPSVQQALKSAAAFIQDPLGVALSVLVEFEVYDKHRGKRQTMYLGTRLNPKANQSDALVTHCICIAEEGKFLAKIHLDRDFSAKDPTSKPTPHIQTGGRAIPELQKKITEKPFWRDDMDKPRIPSMPFCTALLWQWAFLEYPVERGIAPFLYTGWWPHQIRRTEEALLKPFFDDGMKLLTERPASGLLRSFYVPLAR